jgi:hypothetical protein
MELQGVNPTSSRRSRRRVWGSMASVRPTSPLRLRWDAVMPAFITCVIALLCTMYDWTSYWENMLLVGRLAIKQTCI